MIHAGQFAILKERLELPEYRYEPLANGWILSCHRRLRVHFSSDRQLLLLGIAWQALPGREQPEAELEKLCAAHPEGVSRRQVLEMEETWCGRYVLICDGEVYTDACGLLPVFYSPLGISSDCALLAEASGEVPQLYRPREGIVMNWMPGPLTHYPSIRRLLPSCVYQYETGGLESRSLLASSRWHIPEERQRIQTFVAHFECSLRNMQAAMGQVKWLLALTGGYDSRTLFAIACHAGFPFEAYTLAHKGIYEDDVSIPKKLCAAVGVAHRYVPMEGTVFSEEREAAYNEHVSGLIRDQDREYYARRQFETLSGANGDTALLRSGIWEIPREFFGRVFQSDRPAFDFYDWFGVLPDSREKESLEAYFAWTKAHPQPGLDLCNTFYWEQRAGCWLSAIEAGFDLLDGIYSLQPANCRYLLTMMMDFPREERVTKQFQKKIIQYACPAISEIPFGTKKVSGESRMDVFSQKLKRGVHRLRTMGLKKTWKTYLSMIQDRRELNDLKKKTEKRD